MKFYLSSFMLPRLLFENKGLKFKLLWFLFPFSLLLSPFQPFAQVIKPSKEEPKGIFFADEPNWKDASWKQDGFDFYIGAGAYFAGKQTANYYNGAPNNEFKLDLIFNNKHYREEVYRILKRAYPYIDTMLLRINYNTDSRYNIAMDIALGGKYRFKNNWFVELSYSFRRLSCENRFDFTFPGVPPGNKENPNYSKWEFLLAKEDRHYIDFSVGYIFHAHHVVKPFISVGGLFSYINIKSFQIFIESDKPTFDLMAIAKNPNYIPGAPTMPNYTVWKGPGYGCSLTVGLKLAVNSMVSLDPVFQLTAASFGNGGNLPGFNTKMCLNYFAGIRLVMNDALLSKNKR